MTLIKSFLIPLVLSSLIYEILGGIILSVLSIVIQLFLPLRTINDMFMAIVISSYVISYITIIIFSLVKFKYNKIRTIAIFIGPLIATVLSVVGIYLWILFVFAHSGY